MKLVMLVARDRALKSSGGGLVHVVSVEAHTFFEVDNERVDGHGRVGVGGLLVRVRRQHAPAGQELAGSWQHA